MSVANNRASRAKEQKMDPELNADFDPDLDTEFDSEPDADFDPKLASEFDTDPEETDADIEFTDNVGEISVEIDVEELIAELEAEGRSGCEQKDHSTRKRLEDILEAKRAAHEIDEIDEIELADQD